MNTNALSFYHLPVQLSTTYSVFSHSLATYGVPTEEWMSTPMDLPELMSLPLHTPTPQSRVDASVDEPPKKKRGISDAFNDASPTPLPKMNPFLEYRQKRSAAMRQAGEKMRQTKISKQASNEWKWKKVETNVAKKIKREPTIGDDVVPVYESARVPEEDESYVDRVRYKEEFQFMGLFLEN